MSSRCRSMSRLVSTCHLRCQRLCIEARVPPERAPPKTCGSEVQCKVLAVLGERQTALSDLLDHPSLVENGARIAALPVSGDDVGRFAKRDRLQIEFRIAAWGAHLDRTGKDVTTAVGAIEPALDLGPGVTLLVQDRAGRKHTRAVHLCDDIR